MKRMIIAAVALAAIVSCNKETHETESIIKGEKYILEAEVPEDATKSHWDLSKSQAYLHYWDNNDKLSVIVKNAEGEFRENTAFTRIKGNKTQFTGNFVNGKDSRFNGPSESGTNTWYAFFPYDESLKTVGDGDGKLRIKNWNDKNHVIIVDPGTQEGPDNMRHLQIPLYGTCTTEGKASPTIKLKPLCAVIEVEITNPGTEAITVTSIKISTDANEKVVRLSGECGTILTGDPVFTAAKTGLPYTELKVNKGEIGGGLSGKFYVLCAAARLQPNGCTKITTEINTTSGKMTVIKQKGVDQNFPYQFAEGYIYPTRITWKAD